LHPTSLHILALAWTYEFTTLLFAGLLAPERFTVLREPPLLGESVPRKCGEYGDEKKQQHLHVSFTPLN
jgi:hypothetical protein